MRKKFFAMYALVGALVASPVFTSCIDGEESASVTAVRNAKAEAIKAQTEINKANAEYNAKMQEYQLALNKINLESSQMNLEQKKIEFEKIKYQTEQAIVQAKYNIALHTKMMYDQQDELLTNLTDDYTTALDSVIEYKQAIILKNADIVALEQGIVDVQEWIAGETESLNDKIAEAEATIALWKDAETTDKTGLDEKITALKAIQSKLTEEQNALEARYGEMDYTTTSNAEAIKLATIAAANKLVSAPYNTNITNDFNVNGVDYDYDFVTKDVDGYLILKQKEVTAYKQHIAEQLAATGGQYDVKAAEEDLAFKIAALGTEADKADTKYQSTPTTKDLTAYAALAAAKEALATAEKAYAPLKEALDKAEAALNEKKTAENEAYNAWYAENSKGANADATKLQTLADAHIAAQNATATAQTAYNTANAALTQTIKDAYTDAIDDVQDAEVAVAAAKDAVNMAENDLASTKDLVEGMKNFDSYVAAFEGDDYAAYKAAVDALAANGDELTEVGLEIAVLEELNGDGYIDVAAKIADLEEEIEGYKEDIAKLEKASLTALPEVGNMGGDGDYSEADIEVLIAFVKEQIANLEIKLELAEKRAEQAKAALDAYLASDEDGEAEA